MEWGGEPPADLNICSHSKNILELGVAQKHLGRMFGRYGDSKNQLGEVSDLLRQVIYPPI